MARRLSSNTRSLGPVPEVHLCRNNNFENSWMNDASTFLMVSIGEAKSISKLSEVGVLAIALALTLFNVNTAKTKQGLVTIGLGCFQCSFSEALSFF